MNIPFNAERLARCFTTLCEIDSPSRSEEKLADFLLDTFSAFPGIQAFVDDSALNTGSATGNIVFRLPHTSDKNQLPLFFNCHMDVIDPCLGVKVQRHGDIFTSAGPTVLGGDDKAGIAILIELAHILFENKLPFRPLEFLFTTCEEIGLLGAKAFNPEVLMAKHGFALDSTGVDNIIIGAPAAVYVDATIQGRAAHAGLNPEDGMSAIVLASHAISHLPLGRLDADSTANIGIIHGGTATNIVPEHVQLKGEIRSHSQIKLRQHISHFKNIFTTTVSSLSDHQAHLSFTTPQQYPALHITDNSPLMDICHLAADKLHRKLDFIKAGGGSDANIFNASGLETAILGTGMSHVHSTAEQISLSDIIRTLELVYHIATD